MTSMKSELDIPIVLQPAAGYFFCEVSMIYSPKFFPVSCHLGPKVLNGKIVLIRFEHVHKKYKTRVGDRQRNLGFCGILAQKVSVRPSVRTRALIMLLYQI